MLHGYLCWCYTEVRAQYVVDWLLISQLISTPLQSDRLWRTSCILSAWEVSKTSQGRWDCIPVAPSEHMQALISAHSVFRLFRDTIGAHCLGPEACFGKPGGHDRVFVYMVAAPLLRYYPGPGYFGISFGTLCQLWWIHWILVNIKSTNWATKNVPALSGYLENDSSQF